MKRPDEGGYCLTLKIRKYKNALKPIKENHSISGGKKEQWRWNFLHKRILTLWLDLIVKKSSINKAKSHEKKFQLENNGGMKRTNLYEWWWTAQWVTIKNVLKYFKNELKASVEIFYCKNESFSLK